MHNLHQNIRQFNAVLPSTWLVWGKHKIKRLETAINVLSTLTLTTLNYFCINRGAQMCFFQLKIIRNGLVTSFRFIWIPMLSVYSHSKYFFSAGTVFVRQNLTSLDVRFWRIKTVPALKGLTVSRNKNSFVQSKTCARDIFDGFLSNSRGRFSV